ncbi:hypothetical protein HDU67_004176, partial [Dinochytrium kinnereticum]
MGNTCFMNSVLQSMVSLPSLYIYLRDRCYVYYSPLVPPNEEGEKPALKVTEAMLDLAVALNDPRRTKRSLRPTHIVAAIAASKPGNRRLMCYDQQRTNQINPPIQDAHELFQLVSSILTDEEHPSPPIVSSLFDLSGLRAECTEERLGLLGGVEGRKRKEEGNVVWRGGVLLRVGKR